MAIEANGGFKNPENTRICPVCRSVEPEWQTVCSICGEKLKMRSVIPPIQETLHDRSQGSPVPDEAEKQINLARITLLVVSILMIGFTFVLWNMVSKKSGAIPTEMLVSVRLNLFISLMIGFAFLGLFFYAKSNPFGACLIAFILYLTSILVNLGTDPNSLKEGFWFKVVIFVVLGNGIKAGLAYKKSMHR